jgi:hypothetical protein
VNPDDACHFVPALMFENGVTAKIKAARAGRLKRNGLALVSGEASAVASWSA